MAVFVLDQVPHTQSVFPALGGVTGLPVRPLGPYRQASGGLWGQGPLCAFQMEKAVCFAHLLLLVLFFVFICARSRFVKLP